MLKGYLLNVRGSPPEDGFRKLALGIEFLTAWKTLSPIT
jgi:hypothetical protein